MSLRVPFNHPWARATASECAEHHKPNKFNARQVVVDGERFGSEKEWRRFCELKMLERAKHISDVRAHPQFLLFGARGQYIGTFTPDSCYWIDDQLIVEDVKSAVTRRLADYRLRVRIFRACFPTVKFVEA